MSIAFAHPAASYVSVSGLLASPMIGITNGIDIVNFAIVGNVLELPVVPIDKKANHNMYALGPFVNMNSTLDHHPPVWKQITTCMHLVRSST